MYRSQVQTKLVCVRLHVQPKARHNASQLGEKGYYDDEIKCKTKTVAHTMH